MIVSFEIMEISAARDNKKKIIYTLTDDQGKVLGPFVEHRPEEESPEDFINTHIEALNTPPSEGE